MSGRSLRDRVEAGRVRISHVLAVGAALATVGVVAPVAPAFVAGVSGTLALAWGLAFRTRGAVVLAGTVLFGATLLTAISTGDATAALVGGFGAVLAADAGTFALGIERDAGPDVPTARVELLHAVGSGAVAVLTAGVGYALYRSVPSGTVPSVVALLFGAVVLALALGSTARSSIQQSS
ncbi:MAG: hypothetical protein ABEJ40_01200 [Haloarculaceae archaeon]